MQETKNGNGTGLARTEAPAALALTGAVRINGFGDVWTLAQHLAKARGFVPSQFIGQPESLAAVILTGVELGMGPMEAMRSLHVIEGKPTMSAEAMLARARKAGVRTRWLEMSAEKATIEVTVPGEVAQKFTFTMAEAKAAGLAGKGNWLKHPAAMLRARAASGGMRAFCPEVLGAGVYESESGEITEGVPTGNVIEATLVEEAPKSPPKAPARKRMSECANPAELKAWCEENAEMVRDGGDSALARVVKHAEPMGVAPLVVGQWLGVKPAAPVELEDGSLSDDPPE